MDLNDNAHKVQHLIPSSHNYQYTAKQDGFHYPFNQHQENTRKEDANLLRVEKY